MSKVQQHLIMWTATLIGGTLFGGGVSIVAQYFRHTYQSGLLAGAAGFAVFISLALISVAIIQAKKLDKPAPAPNKELPPQQSAFKPGTTAKVPGIKFK